MSVTSLTHTTIKEYLLNNGNKHLLRKGKELFRNKACKLLKLNTWGEEAEYTVASEVFYGESYKVEIAQYNNYMNLQTSCTCANDWQTLCEHRVAALYDLSGKLLIENGKINSSKTNTARKKDNSNINLLTTDGITDSYIKANTSKESWQKAKVLAKNKRAIITKEKDRTVEASVTFKKTVYQVLVKQYNERQILTNCSCEEQEAKICLHKAVLLLQLKIQYGQYALEYFKDWSATKNKLLAPYGFTCEDDLTNKFNFEIGDNRKLKLIVIDKAIVKQGELLNMQPQNTPLAPSKRQIKVPSQKKKRRNTKEKSFSPTTTPSTIYTLGYVLTTADLNYFPYFEVKTIVGKLTKNGKGLKQIQLLYNRYGKLSLEALPKIDEQDLQLLNICKNLHWKEIGKQLQQTYPDVPTYSWLDGGGYYVNEGNLTDKLLPQTFDYVYKQLEKLFEIVNDKILYKIKNERLNINNQNLTKLTIAQKKINLHFETKKDDSLIVIQSFVKIEENIHPINTIKLIGQHLLLHDDQLFLLESLEMSQTIKLFYNKPTIKVGKEHLPKILENFIFPLQQKYSFDNTLDLNVNHKVVAPTAQVYLQEEEDYLVIQPVISYGDKQVEIDGHAKILYQEGEQIISIERDTAYEKNFATFIEGLHPDFPQQKNTTDGFYYYVEYPKVMHQNWFLSFSKALEKAGIALFGFKTLSKFRYNINTPEFELSIGSGVDWFDIKGEVKFGEQTATLRDVRKALIKKEHFIALSDGKLGVLPEQWVKKYETIFKIGRLEDDGLKLSKIHFSLVDDLYEQIDDVEVQAELQHKKEALQKFTKIKTTKVPKTVKASLRPYQKEGLNWLNFLAEFKWGGILADDMGLGKTLQILTFLQAQKDAHGSQPNLVILPTSLILNWEEEVKKFCKNLTTFKFHGSNRDREDSQQFNKYDIILTSYTTMTLDIELLSQITFRYIILDESQAIKNPTTKRYKASRLLKANNRIALTGTPIENNTFDLYAQMNFLNPGILGSMEFFKKEFANPIDKQADDKVVNELKKIIYPFVLRRTKKMVATDLPDKIETTLYCDMESNQRHVYEAFRETYKSKILDRIDTEGMAKAGMYILEGLTKLRQICDSPALLKDSADYGDASIKLKELMKHITEKTGNHKILIFSQFLGMLGMIKTNLSKIGIDYEYLDGSIAPKKRQKSVKRFQENEGCRVFLISLKAGGVGLNLTAADYVYLVDPWWNPAAEQQAIDRTHRIGQTQKVFAYKMICTNTIEEKILQLQEKKKSLATDIISTEKSFIKKLKRADIAYLFS